MNKSEQNGLYVTQLERDSCGVGMIADLKAVPTQYIVDSALTMLANMKHRGACGFEQNTGDGDGILTQIPHEFLQNIFLAKQKKLPPLGKYGLGMFFFPKDKIKQEKCKDVIRSKCKDFDFEIIYERDVPTDSSILGVSALDKEPRIVQLVLKSIGFNNKDVENRLYFLRNTILQTIYLFDSELFEDFYIASLSSKTIVYKGLLTAMQLGKYYSDLNAPDFKSSVAIVHSRFSTNTLPQWKLAQPFRVLRIMEKLIRYKAISIGGLLEKIA